MMNKTRTAKVHVLRFLFVLPLLVISLLAFRNTTRRQAGPLSKPVTDTIPNKQAMVITRDTQRVEINKTGHTVDVKLKNGQVEKYDLLNPKEKAAFEAKYGPLPEPPAPPAPPAAVQEKLAPIEVDKAPPLAPPVPDVLITPDQIQRMDVIKVDNMVTITLKNGEKDTYNLNDPKQKAAFQNKYGKLPPPPPPPAAPAPAAAPAAVPAPLPAAAGVAAPKPAAAPAPVITADNVVIIRPDDVKANAHVKTVLSNLVAVKEDAIATILNSTTEAQLKQIQQQLQEKGYTLELENVITVGGMLKELWGSISDAQGNKSNFAAADFSRVVISSMKDDKGAPSVLIIRVKSQKPVTS